MNNKKTYIAKEKTSNIESECIIRLFNGGNKSPIMMYTSLK
ncbi:MAG: hypothetical protein ABIL44_11460 [candidate division WOR-3 bacterium]